MNPHSFRLRGLVPGRLRRAVRRVVPRSEVSQAGLRRFLKEMDHRPRVDLPREAPRSLSLVVPCFSHAAYLPDLLESIVAQTRQPDEVVFVDDASPDATNEIVREFVASQRKPDGGRFVVLVNDRNMGQAASLNRGISAASSDLVMILNDDDYLMHDAIETMLGFFKRYRQVAMIGAHSIHFSGRDALAESPKLSTAYTTRDAPVVVHGPEEVRRYRRVNDLNMTHSGLCFRKVAWQTVGGYGEIKSRRIVPFSDRDFELRVNALWPVAVAPTTPLSFWRSDSSVDVGRDS